MADGHLNVCKVCVRVRVQVYREKNIDKIKERDRQRGQIEKRQAASRNRYRKRTSTPEGRAAEWERRKKYQNTPKREANILKRAANIIVGNAIRDGKIKRNPCARCGEKEAQAHHEDYSRPLDVVWLCTYHHGERHREINEERRKANKT